MNTTMLDGTNFRQLLLSGAAVLEREREVVNNLNVFPVPDGDTGTNMSMTINAVNSDYHAGETSIAAYSAAVARDMMRAARGNSGVILSLFFRGMARAFEGHDAADPRLMLRAVREGAKSAASAVDRPVEGTILTVMRECAADEETEAASSFETLFDALYEKAEIVLQQTPEMLPALRRAHVVDSGGYGFVRILEGMKRAIHHEEIAVSSESDAEQEKQPLRQAADFEAFSEEEIRFAFCTECLLDLKGELSADELNRIKTKLSAIGDSIVLTADEEVLKVHIHTNQPLTVLNLLYPLGTLRTSKVENMKLQHNGLAVSSGKLRERKKCSVFAVSPGDGFTDLFKELGADMVISGGQSMNPSADDLMKAIEECPCETAIILPNNSNIIMTANQVRELLTDTHVIVIPTKTLPQGVSAMFAYNESRTPEENQMEMTETFARVATFSVTRAVRDAEVDGISVRAQQFLGLAEGTVIAAEDTMENAISALIPEIPACEVVTLYYGKGIREDEAERISLLLTDVLDDCAEVSVAYGGQPLYPYILSAE